MLQALWNFQQELSVGGTGRLMPASEPAGKAPPSIDLTHALGRIQVPLRLSKGKRKLRLGISLVLAD